VFEGERERGGRLRTIRKVTGVFELMGCRSRGLTNCETFVRVDEMEVEVFGGHKAECAGRLRQRHHRVVVLDQLHDRRLHAQAHFERGRLLCRALGVLAERGLEREVQNAVGLADIEHAAGDLLTGSQLALGLVVRHQTHQILQEGQAQRGAGTSQLHRPQS
jgi:hypothetical protein